MEAEYDIPTLIHAIPSVLARWPEACFVLAGEGETRAHCERLAVDLGIARSVQFLGRISHKEMPELLGKADVYVTTAVTDGGSVSLCEAMACGALPIGTDIPANREWIEPGRNGLLFLPGDSRALADAVLDALDRPAWRAAAAAANWARIGRSAVWTTTMDKVERLYASLIAEAGR
jgi:glycosyltransferase involved in cell wall biosynthesis